MTPQKDERDVPSDHATPAIPEPVEPADNAAVVHIELPSTSPDLDLEELAQRIESGERVVVEDGTITVGDIPGSQGVAVGRDVTVHVEFDESYTADQPQLSEGEPGELGPRIPGPPDE